MNALMARLRAIEADIVAAIEDPQLEAFRQALHGCRLRVREAMETATLGDIR